MDEERPSNLQLEGHDVGEYTIVRAFEIDELVKRVNSLIEEKWFPIGGPLAGNDPAGKPLIVQALIRSKFAKMKKIGHA